MRSLFLSFLGIMASLALASCHESLEERAARESKEYTEKYCPTPPQNNVITDSMTFSKVTRTQTYYMRLTGPNDNAELVKAHEQELRQQMLAALRQNPEVQAYKDAGFIFEYVARSEKDPATEILHFRFGPKDYGNDVTNKK